MGLELWRGSVPDEWLDYNGHMTEHRYLQVFGESSDALFQRIGVDLANAAERAFYTLETRISHLAECRVRASLWTATEILAYDEKRLHLYHRLFGSDGKLLAIGEHLAVHVRHGCVTPAAHEMQNRIAGIYAAMANEPLPEGVGSVLKRPLAVSRHRGS
ncbi:MULTISPECIES: thioesterase family protein [Paracoccaceae]|jgi:acyl-CoA thioester hydrolase/carnitine 3-dehydrogenase|uniref:thioesterase family protein n=1 Tax=Paracoccaceae TaxID=31989 RepID=UPI0030621916